MNTLTISLIIAGVIAVGFLVLLAILLYYRRAYKKSQENLHQEITKNVTLEMEIDNAQQAQKIKNDTATLNDNELDKRLREQGYYRKQ